MRARFRLRVAAIVPMVAALPAWSAASAAPLTARACLGVALQAADAWADDARLVWVENDAPVDDQGRAAAWGFLFFSPDQGAMRSYSVRDGVLDLADDHAVTAPAPALDAWIDSRDIVRQALKRAEEKCQAGCALETLLVVRGVFASRTTWVAVFRPAGEPRLFVVIDATSGDVIRDWRG